MCTERVRFKNISSTFSMWCKLEAIWVFCLGHDGIVWNFGDFGNIYWPLPLTDKAQNLSVAREKDNFSKIVGGRLFIDKRTNWTENTTSLTKVIINLSVPFGGQTVMVTHYAVLYKEYI